MKFSVGDKVYWKSQSQGYTKVKEGMVVEVVAEGDRPNQWLFHDLYKGIGCGRSRDHESYVVKVKSKHYWPLVAHLQLCDNKNSAVAFASKWCEKYGWNPDIIENFALALETYRQQKASV